MIFEQANWTRIVVHELSHLISGTVDHDDRYAQGRDQARKESWEYEGTGAQRAADYLIAKQKELSSSEEAK